jgi:hypothetical protein
VLASPLHARKEAIRQLDEGQTGEQAVAASLVLGADALHIEQLGEVFEAAVQVVAELHEVPAQWLKKQQQQQQVCSKGS